MTIWRYTSLHPIRFSLVIPLYNEDENLHDLYHKILDATKKEGLEFEVIFVDDGSSDDTFAILKALFEKDARLIVIKFRKNFGQHAALLAGFIKARGDIIISLDADFRNEPGDISKLLAMMEGYDVIKGWRMERAASPLRKVYSLISNAVFRILICKEVHDYGCALGAFRKDLLEDAGRKENSNLLKYAHLYCLKKAGRVGEIVVREPKTDRVVSKYNFVKLLRLFVDILWAICRTSKTKTSSDFYEIESVLTH